MDKAQIKKLVGQKIRENRLNLKLSQFALGEVVGVNQRQIAQIECGKSLPSLNTLVKLSEIFNCNVSEFFECPIKKTDEKMREEINQMISKFNSSKLEFLLSFVKQFSKVK